MPSDFDWFQQVGNRVLVLFRDHFFTLSGEPHELMILEVSPSGNRIKYQTLDGKQAWRHEGQLHFLEQLTDASSVSQLKIIVGGKDA